MGLMYSFDGVYWVTSATLAAGGASWTTLSGSVAMGPLDNSLYVRVGGRPPAALPGME